MNSVVAYFWRHPRRSGFITLNIVILVAFAAWGVFTAGMTRQGVGGIPNLMLGYTGMALLALLWVVAWLAWGWLIFRRHLAEKARQT